MIFYANYFDKSNKYN